MWLTDQKNRNKNKKNRNKNKNAVPRNQRNETGTKGDKQMAQF